MAKFKAYDYRQRVFLPVSLEDQLMPGTLKQLSVEGGIIWTHLGFV